MRKIKLFLSLLMVMLVSVGNVWAADESVTFSDQGYSNQQEISSYAGTDFSIAFNKGTNNSNAPKYYSSGTAIRAYGGNYFTVSSTKTIATIELTFGSSDGSNEITTDVVTYSDGTWNGSATSVTFTIGGTSGNRRLAGVAVTFAGGCSSEVNITKGAESHGTYTLSAAKVCADGEGGEITISDITPVPGYEFDEITTSASGTVDNNLRKVTGIKAATTITVKFKEKQKYTVTWNVNGGTSTSQVYEGNKPVFPATPEACDATSTTFVGWATAPWTGKIANLDDKTVYTSADAMPAVSAAVTYYAVFAKVAGESGWVETAIGNLSASDVFVFSDGSYALNNDGGTSNAPSANAITVLNGKITSAVADKLKWNISGNATDGYTFYPNGSTTTWLYCNTTESSSSNNNMRVGTGGRKLFEINSNGYVVTKDTYTARYLSIFNSADFRGYVGTGNGAFVPKFYKYSAGTASDYMTTCCTKYNVAIAAGIENGSVTADIASACEGTEITLTPSAAGGYHLDAWDVYKTGESATKVTVTANKFNMPAYDVTVSASFVHDDCENLDAPTLNEIVKTYNSANIAWSTVTDAVAYAVSVVKDGESEPVFSGNVTELSKALENLEPETQYNYTIMAVGDGTAKCADGNGVLEGNFTTEALPTAVLTLMENGNEVAGGSHAITVPFALPTAVTHTCGKTFVGWTSKSDFADGDEELSSYYEKGAEFTFENTNTVTLYAVYADGGATEEKATVSIADYAAANSWANETKYTSITLDENITATANGGGNTGKYYNSGSNWRFYQGESATITIATAVGELSSAKFTYSVSNTGILKDGEDNVVENGTAVSASGTSAVYHVANSGTATNGQVRFTAIEVKYLKPGTLSNYSITCAAAPEAIVDPEVINATAEGVAAGIIEAAYDNVDEEHVSVDLYNDEDCTEEFEGSWLTASINGDKNIAYTIAENTSYNDARTAYIKLTAPETTGATAPAVVIIPVSQAKKAAVFSSLEELVAADVNANTEVTVSFSDVVIKEMYEYNDNVCGVVFNIQKAGQDIKIYFNSQTTISGWVAGGKLSGTLTNCPWKIFSDAWQLAPKSGWAWANLAYEAPAVVSNVAVSGTPTKTTYNTGEAFDPAGLTVTVTYSNTLVETITANDANWAYVFWSKDPATFAAEHVGTNKSVSVTATYNAIPSSATEISGLTINKIAVSGVSLNKNAATLKTGKTLTLTATITPENATYKTVSWKSDDTDIATVNEDGVVTAVAAGTTTITATSTDDNTKTATCELTIIESVNFNNGVWKLVTNKDELTAGSYIIIASADVDEAMKPYAGGSDKNCKTAEATIDDGLLTYNSVFAVYEIGAGNQTNTFALQDISSNKYLYASSSSSNDMKTEETLSDNSSWTASITSEGDATLVAQGENTRNVMHYNPNGTNPSIFSCYASNSSVTGLVNLYKFYIKVTFEANGGSAVDPVYVEYNESVAAPANPTKDGYRFNGWKLNSVAYDFATQLKENITLVADWSQLYAVNYAAGEGSGDAPAAAEYVADETFDLAAANTFTAPAGKEFDGWLCDIDAVKYAANAEYTMTAAATTFTAQWKQITYAVTYVSAHGTAPDAENAASVTLVELTEAGWTHTGWVANVDVEVDDATVTAGTPIANGKVVVLSAATEFTAQWTEDTPTPVYTEVRSGLVAGNYYTICFNKAMTDVQGATLWSFVGKDADFAYIVQETATTIEAGKPYILYATASTVTAVLGDETNAPGANGAIHGTFSNLTQDQLNTYATVAGNDLYLVIGNQLRKATGYANDGITPLTGNSLPANRAFVVLGDIPNAPAHMPAHVRSMPLHKDTATGMDELNASETPVKMMINGQLFILRGEKMYDATGRLVK